MAQVTKEQIAQAREIDLLTYLQSTAPQELQHVSGGTYCLKSHDSLKLSNGKWYWWSRGLGGATALDYLIKVEGMSFTEAVEQLTGKAALRSYAPPVTREAERKVLKLPARSDTPFRVIAYLSSRGIDQDIIRQALNNGSLYESLPYHSAVFVGSDEAGEPRYAAWRATSEQRMMGDCSGSDKRFSFRLSGSNVETVHFFESAIDAMSYASILKQSGRNWREENLVSLAGIAASAEKKLPLAAEQYLKSHPQTRRIYLHLDRDEPGKNAAKAMKALLEKDYVVLDVPPPQGKDYNDFLRIRIQERGRDLRQMEAR